MSLEERNTALEATVETLRKELEDRSLVRLAHFPSAPPRRELDLDVLQTDPLNDLTEQIGKILIDPRGHARTLNQLYFTNARVCWRNSHRSIH